MSLSVLISLVLCTVLGYEIIKMMDLRVVNINLVDKWNRSLIWNELVQRVNVCAADNLCGRWIWYGEAIDSHNQWDEENDLHFANAVEEKKRSYVWWGWLSWFGFVVWLLSLKTKIDAPVDVVDSEGLHQNSVTEASFCDKFCSSIRSCFGASGGFNPVTNCRIVGLLLGMPP